MGLGQKILYFAVRNEAMKEDPPEIYGWRVFALACSACFGGMIFGMDIGIIGGVLTLPAFMKYIPFVMFASLQVKLTLGWHYSKYGITGLSKTAAANLSSNIVSTMQVGCFVGCLIAIWVGDRWGRRMALIVSAAVTMVGCIFQASAEGYLAVLYIGR